MHVVATAGHVDHGKSTLVSALTGQDPDRLAEEKARGLSIQLGYCWTTLPEVGEVAFVDVPGHQRFIATTLAGLGPMGARGVVMFVVAADDPWMPQAREHLAALDALGIERGLLVVTRSDLADPRPALDAARAELDRTSLAGIGSVVVSGRTGQGIDDLRTSLVEVLATTPEPDPEADVRLWVDRRFQVRGIGAVVTGTLAKGTIAVGDRLAHHVGQVRVRGIESLKREVGSVRGPARVALALGGDVSPEVDRGSVLVAPGRFEDTRVADVRVAGEHDLPEQPLLHVGTSLVGVRARPLGDGFVRLRLDAPLPLRVGDRLLLRDPGRRAIWGARVLDPAPPPLDRRGAGAARATALADVDESLDAQLALRGVVRRSRLSRLGVVGDPPAGTLVAGDWLVSAEQAAHLRARLTEVVLAASTPLQPTMPMSAAARALGLDDPELVAALVAPPLRLVGGEIGPATDGVPDELAQAAERLRAATATDRFRAPEAEQLAELGLDAAVLGALARQGLVLRLAEGVVLPAGSDAAAVEVLRALPQPFTASQARQALGTSRRVVLPLLAHLDRTGRTVRLPDDRRTVRPVTPTR